MTKRNKHVDSSLEDFLEEEGVLKQSRAVALKKTLAGQIQQAIEKDKISKVEIVRPHDRFLDPRNASATLQTLTREAHAVGRDLRIELT